MANIFGHDVDLMNVAKVVVVVAGVFSLNSAEEKQLSNYVKLNNIQWVEKRRRDSEIESMLRDKVREIK